MAALSETRDVGSYLTLPPSVRRICCIGDSLTYGQGVAPRQTLSAHVARLANMAYPDHLIWVDNMGQSSGNIWHGWVPFKRLLETVQFDVAIFSLCHNDAQIFESNSVSYGDNLADSWLVEGALRPMIKRTLADIAQVAADRGICIIMDFYTMWDADKPFIEAVERECREIGLPFVDLLQFLKQESGLSIAEFRSSPYDGHPSDRGHQMAARRIVRELLERWQPAAPEGDGGPLGDRLVAACDAAVGIGWSPDDIAGWASLVADAKQVVARRRRPMPDAGALVSLAGAQAAIDDRYRGWYASRAASARDRALYERRHNLETTLDRAYAALRNLDELMFALEAFEDGPTLVRLWGMIDAAGYYAEKDRLRELPSDLRHQWLLVAEGLGEGDVDDHMPVLRQYKRLRSDLGHDLRRLAALLPDRLQAGTFEQSQVGLWQVADNLVNVVRTYFRELDKLLPGSIVQIPLRPAAFTEVKVWVERDTARPKRGGVFNLEVEVDYIEPRRSRQRCKQWGGADEDAYVYRFEMPLLLLGDVGVGVPDWDDMHRRFIEGDLRLARIEISNLADQPAGKQERFQWKPSPNTAPVHWVRLDRLLVAN